ncbi:HET domain-containing protein [Colletotrichum higginsianum IMI 349063]|uniref:HET domain-containing protein n=2 Tax=Colletotrichum higginsianum (strain IMI 349063) TaxID=759273 RepID=A0A1B7YQ21_COLHI|nr:HET domain-containing protein [Colletotrichum higginsianum IMI 349063]OBR14131.1 HET domain-containing protein [Colletotrichum higginsianum IMI 349063]
MKTAHRVPHDAAEEIKWEILRLKNKAVSDDTKGHSCEHCRIFIIRLRPVVNHSSEHGGKTLQFDTTDQEVFSMAASGCAFWSMIRERIAYLQLKEKVEQETERVSFDSEKHGFRLSDKHYQDLAVSLGGLEGREFLRLHHNPDVDWIRPRKHIFTNSSMCQKLPPPPPYQMRIMVQLIMRFSRIIWKSFCVDVRLGVFKSPTETSSIEQSATFLALVPPVNIAEAYENTIASPINLLPNSPTTFALIKNWLRRCEVQHKCGILNLPSLMPSLILKVLSRDSAILIKVPSNMRERYLALSYCWGRGTQKLLLNKDNKSALMSGISIPQLDPTIRDAMITTYELGHKLLWIDALCILQDDEDFKARELSRMGDIYRCASFTIVASAAKEVSEGFLAKRASTMEKTIPADKKSQLVFKMEANSHYSSSADPAPFPVIFRPGPKEMDRQEPWYRRAWTLQEALFSRRQLQYRNSQTTWICYCTEQKAQQYDGWVDARWHCDPGYSDADILEEVTELLWNRLKPAHISTIHDCWYRLITAYCDREMTHQTDRLPAISAIARKFAFISGDEYHYGLWKSDLATGLGWKVKNGPRPSRAGRVAAGSRPAPSWSWASVSCGITWLSLDPRKKSKDFDVLGCYINLSLPRGPSSKVQATDIHIRGLIVSISPIPKLYAESQGVMSEDGLIYIHPDYTDDDRLWTDSGSKAELLVLSTKTELVNGIVLVEKGTGRYVRVGTFETVQYAERRVVVGWSTEKEYLAQVRRFFGGKENIREIVLV